MRNLQTVYYQVASKTCYRARVDEPHRLAKSVLSRVPPDFHFFCKMRCRNVAIPYSSRMSAGQQHPGRCDFATRRTRFSGTAPLWRRGQRQLSCPTSRHVDSALGNVALVVLVVFSSPGSCGSERHPNTMQIKTGVLQH